MSRSATNDPRTLVEAGQFLVDRGFCGLIWLDTELLVRERAGGLVDFVTLDQPVGTSVLPLFGMEDDIRALRINPRHHLELANVRIAGKHGESPRLNFYLHWLEPSGRFLVIVIRATSQSEIEAQLENEMRRRRLLEAKTFEQATELSRANAELRRANRDLDEYANIISHDLKSPMRALRYFAEDIEQALDAGDREAAKAQLRDLKQQARRMSHMLTDLLTYSRIGPNSEETITETDTRELAEAIIASLPRPRGFTVEIAGVWPVMQTVQAALDLVLRNLVDNAIKHHDRGDGQIRLEARAAATGIDITVSDDGPGIDPKYHEVIFQPFRRIDLRPSTSAAETSGMGLSLVRKTVERNGARLTIESAPGSDRGTTFSLHWPGTVVA